MSLNWQKVWNLMFYALSCMWYPMIVWGSKDSSHVLLTAYLLCKPLPYYSDLPRGNELGSVNILTLMQFHLSTFVRQSKKQTSASPYLRWPIYAKYYSQQIEREWIYMILHSQYLSSCKRFNIFICTHWSVACTNVWRQLNRVDRNIYVIWGWNSAGGWGGGWRMSC